LGGGFGGQSAIGANRLRDPRSGGARGGKRDSAGLNPLIKKVNAGPNEFCLLSQWKEEKDYDSFLRATNRGGCTVGASKGKDEIWPPRGKTRNRRTSKLRKVPALNYLKNHVHGSVFKCFEERKVPPRSRSIKLEEEKTRLLKIQHVLIEKIYAEK